MISPHILKMKKKARKAKAAVEKKQKEAESNIGKSLLVFCSFVTVRPLFIFTL